MNQPRHALVRTGLALSRTGLGGASIAYDSVQGRRVRHLQARDLEIMRALWRYGYLTTSQIGDTWWPDRHPSRPQIRLTELTGAGLLLRFRPIVKRGTHQWIYQLAREGFRAAQRSLGSDGPYIAEDARWTERRAADMETVERVVRINGWALAYRLALGDRLLDWRGAREARAALGGAEHGGTAPDAALTIDVGAESSPVELLVELGRDERPVRLAERLRRYDALIGGGWRSHTAPEQAGGPPAVALVARGYRDVDRLLRAADPQLAAPARGRCLFCAEQDMHRGDPRAWMLPAQSPGERGTSDFSAVEVTLPV